MILFFITTNDSGSIILDLIGTSGKTNSSPVQKQVLRKLSRAASVINRLIFVCATTDYWSADVVLHSRCDRHRSAYRRWFEVTDGSPDCPQCDWPTHDYTHHFALPVPQGWLRNGGARRYHSVRLSAPVSASILCLVSFSLGMPFSEAFRPSISKHLVFGLIFPWLAGRG
jgi:hypothetical protein